VLNQMNVVSGTRATFIPDILGSFIGTLDATSGTLTKFGYQTYGESGSPNGSFAYTGQRIDPETGLYYYRARMYSTALGRFNQVDVIGYAAGSNLYAYVKNDPLNFIDSLGLTADTPQGTGSSLSTAQSWLQTAGQNLASAFNTALENQYQTETAEAQGQIQLAQEHPYLYYGTVAAILAAPIVVLAAPELGTAQGPLATLELAQNIANVEAIPMNYFRTVSLLQTAEGPTLVAGGTSDLSAAQVSLANQLGLTPVAAPGLHAEMTAISGASRLGLTPTVGVSTNIVCPSCSIAINQLGGSLTGPRSFVFGFLQ
jgi:RHS repeat-associated protein